MFDINLTWDRPAKISGQTSEHILRVRLQPQDNINLTGIPLRLALALDTSLSMSGEKLESAKTACQTVIAQLRDSDRFSLASFSTKVTPLLQNTERNNSAIASAINKLRASGITRTDLALNWLWETLPNEPNVARVAILITDGQPTDLKGSILEDLNPLTEQADRFSQAGIILCTVGLGDAANFNTGFLTELSDRARGAFLYADTPANLEPQLRDRLFACQAIAVERAMLILKPASGVTLQGFCYFRPEYLPLEETAPGEVPLGALRTNCPTDILISLAVPPANFGDSLDRKEVLQVHFDSRIAPPVTETASIQYTQSYREAQQINEEVNRDRLGWEINLYSTELTRTNDPHRTGELLTNLQVAAVKSGQDNIAQQASQQLDDLKKTGTLKPHNTTALHQATRNLGETS